MMVGQLAAGADGCLPIRPRCRRVYDQIHSFRNKGKFENKPITRTDCGNRTALANGRAHADRPRWCVSRESRVVASSRALPSFSRKAKS